MARQNPPRQTKPYDATTKRLFEINPLDWVRFLGLPGDSCEIISADLATVTTEADRIIRVNTPDPYAIHGELQVNPERRMADRTLRYNVLTEDKLEIPVISVIVLLRRSADRFGNLTGVLERRDRQGQVYLSFRYHVVRVWELPVDTVLQSGLALLPLAPLANVSQSDLPELVREMEARISTATDTEMARFLWTATYILMGLRYEASFTTELLKGVGQMRESVTYQAILAEGLAEGRSVGLLEGRTEGEATGRVREAQNMLLLIGEGRLGKPNAEVTQRVQGISAVEQLEEMAKRLMAVETWDELLEG